MREMATYFDRIAWNVKMIGDAASFNSLTQTRLRSVEADLDVLRTLASPGPTGTAGEPSDEALIEAYSTAYDARATAKSEELSADRYRAACLAGIRAALRAAAAGAAPADGPTDDTKTMAAIIRAAYFGGAAPASPAVRDGWAEAKWPEVRRQILSRAASGSHLLLSASGVRVLAQSLGASPAVREAIQYLRERLASPDDGQSGLVVVRRTMLEVALAAEGEEKPKMIPRLAGPSTHVGWSPDGTPKAKQELLSLVRESDLRALEARAALAAEGEPAGPTE